MSDQKKSLSDEGELRNAGLPHDGLENITYEIARLAEREAQLGQCLGDERDRIEAEIQRSRWGE